MNGTDDAFYDSVPLFAAFEGVADFSRYRPLPEGWALALADIVDSTSSIAGGRYKSVNMAGASVISAILNAVGRRDLPFVFGGDGAVVAVSPDLREVTASVLGAVQVWVAEELGLSMRAALVPLADVRARGLDVCVARFRASDQVSYAMFAGGGVSWSEAEMKAGRYGVPPASPRSRPDLTGLSCRWSPIAARNGEIVSIIAVPGSAGDAQAFQRMTEEIIALVGEQGRGGHPVLADALNYSFPPKGLDAEARASAPRGRRLAAKLKILGLMGLVAAADRLGFGIGPFDPRLYKRDVVENTDFRKFDDGLKMTVDIGPDLLARVEARLAAAERVGVARYGIHRQDSALMTCIVAAPLQRDHVHFVDGAAGGYAMAASRLKAKPAA